MALKQRPIRRARTVGYISYDARLRVKQILDRREAAVEKARRAARRLDGGNGR
jgi:hypothetical protein